MISKEDMKMYNKMTKKQLIQEIKSFDSFIDFMCDRKVNKEYTLYPPYYIMDEKYPTFNPTWPVVNFTKEGTIL